LSLIGALTFLIASNLAAFLAPKEAELIAVITKFIRIMAPTFGFIGVQMGIISTFRAAGQTTTSMLLATAHAFSIFVIAYFLGIVFGFGETGIWWAYPWANLLAMLLAFYFYWQKKWLRTGKFF